MSTSDTEDIDDLDSLELLSLAELQEVIMHCTDQRGKLSIDEWREIIQPRLRRAQEIIRSREAE